MISSIVSRLVILVFGTLYPAYASYKAVRTKNVKEYVKWMMYWIVFALFTCAETFTDVFFSFWFPFYYEFKVILVLWLLSPATKGSSILYRKFVHPMLTKREQEIDEYISRAKEQGYHTVLTLGTKGVNYATSVIMQTAIKGGGGLVNQLRRSYSLSDISSDIDIIADMNRMSKVHPEDQMDHTDAPIDARLLRSRGYSTRSPTEMYFPEVDVDVRKRRPRSREPSVPLSQIRSTEDVSSGYSSGEPLHVGQAKTDETREVLLRTSSVGSARVTRTKPVRTSVGVKRPTPTEDSVSSDESEESDSQNQEDEFFDVSSTITFQPSVIPPIPPPITPNPNTTPTNTHSSFDAADKPSLHFFQDTDELSPQSQLILQSKQVSDTILCDKEPLSQPISLSLIPTKMNTTVNKDEDQPTTAVEMSRESSFDEVDVTSVAPTRMPLVILPSNNSLVASANASCNNKVNNFVAETIEIQNIHSEDLNTMRNDCESLATSSSPEIEDNEDVMLKKEIAETEFFDTEEESSTCDTAYSGSTQEITSHVVSVAQPNAKTSEIKDEVQVSGDLTKDIVKVDRAGKYNKRPAPCPPKKIEVESLAPDQNNAISSVESDTNVASCSSLSVARDELIPSEASSQDKASPLSRRQVTKDVSPRVVDTAEDIALSSVDNSKCDGNVPIALPSTASEDICKQINSGEIEDPREHSDTDQSRSSPSSEKTKRKENSSFSRLLSMPKSQLTSLFPFWSHDSSRGLVATSLTSLSGDLEQQLRSNSSCSNIVTKSPAMPSRNAVVNESKKDSGKANEKSVTDKVGGSSFKLREMSHSPPRRQSKLD